MGVLQRLLLLFLAALVLGAQERPQFVWQGKVDGSAILRLAGKRLTVEVKGGGPVERQKFHFTDALPGTGQNVRLEVLQGRGSVHVVDQPGIENKYTFSMAIEDRQPGNSFYSIALYWDASGNLFESGQRPDRVSWTGLVDETAIVSCRVRTCVSTADHGEQVSGVRFKFSHPMPEREIDVRLED